MHSRIDLSMTTDHTVQNLSVCIQDEIYPISNELFKYLVTELMETPFSVFPNVDIGELNYILLCYCMSQLDKQEFMFRGFEYQTTLMNLVCSDPDPLYIKGNRFVAAALLTMLTTIQIQYELLLEENEGGSATKGRSFSHKTFQQDTY